MKSKKSAKKKNNKSSILKINVYKKIYINMIIKNNNVNVLFVIYQWILKYDSAVKFSSTLKLKTSVDSNGLYKKY